MVSGAEEPNETAASGAYVEVWEPQDPALRRVYSEITAASSMPGVHRFWRMLAAFPSFLVAAWPTFEAALSTQSQQAVADDLVRASFLREAVGLPSHKAFRGDLARAEIDAELRERIERFNSASQIGTAELFALAAAMREGVYGRARLDPSPSWGGATAPRHPRGVYVPPLRAGERRGKAEEVLRRIELEHNLPILDDYYASLARIPDYLAAAWNAIHPIVGDPEYLALASRLVQRAAMGADGDGRAFAARQAAQIGPPAEQAAIRRLLDLLVERVLPQTLIDITLVRALTSGPDGADVAVR
jgi:hypothetical protein